MALSPQLMMIFLILIAALNGSLLEPLQNRAEAPRGSLNTMIVLNASFYLYSALLAEAEVPMQRAHLLMHLIVTPQKVIRYIEA